MKRFTFIFFLIPILFSACSQWNKPLDEKDTLLYFIRHAEKDRSDITNKDPELTPNGLLRAKKWASVFKNTKFDAIYSTTYNRTRQTAQPTAIQNNLTVTPYHPNTLDVTSFINNNKGKIVLIVGHSNSTPQLVNTILGEEKYKQIDDNNNANLYIVTISKELNNSMLLYIN